MSNRHPATPFAFALFALFLAAGAVVLSPRSAAAQTPFGFELRAGPAFAVTDVGDAVTDTGLGFEGSVVFWAMPHAGLYAGWDWHRFGTDGESFAGTGVDVEETGYAFGIRFEHPVGHPGSAAVALRAGGTWNHLEIEEGSDLVLDTGHGLGWEVGAGFAVPFRGWHVTPSVRYRALTREIDFEGGPPEVELNYFTVEVGFGRRF